MHGKNEMEALHTVTFSLIDLMFNDFTLLMNLVEIVNNFHTTLQVKYHFYHCFKKLVKDLSLVNKC